MSAVVIGAVPGSVTATSTAWPAGTASTDIWTVSAKSLTWSSEVESSIRVGGEPYDGLYVIVPSSEEQVLPTRGHTLSENVTVAPIPSNYGLITWNGSTLTVS